VQARDQAAYFRTDEKFEAQWANSLQMPWIMRPDNSPRLGARATSEPALQCERVCGTQGR
jgi:hypothetical protein